MTERLQRLRCELEEMQNRVAQLEADTSHKVPDMSAPDTVTAASEDSPAAANDSRASQDPPCTSTQDTESSNRPQPPTRTDQPEDTKSAQGTSKAPIIQTKPDDEAAKLRSKVKDFKRRVSYLDLLHGFIKSDLGYYLNLQVKVENLTIETIAFEDLWYVIQPGEILYTNDHGHHCLYKVYATTGGQQRRRNPTPPEREGRRYPFPPDNDDSDDEKPPLKSRNMAGIGSWTMFTIDCFYMGFDGVTVGPIDCRKQIKYFSGEMKIRDLPIFPLRFHPAKDEIAAALEKRGRKLLTSYGHKSYNSTTVLKSKYDHQEDINGDIFIDLKSYYRDFGSAKPRLGVLKPTESDQAEVQESELRDRLGNLRFLTDHDVDDHLRENFLISPKSLIEPTSLEFAKNSTMHLQLLSYKVPAYVFRYRRYGKFCPLLHVCLTDLS